MHDSCLAEGALEAVEPGEAHHPLLRGFGFPRLRPVRFLNLQRGYLLLVAAAEDAVVADLHEPVRQDVQAEAAQELHPAERNRLLPGPVAVVLVQEGHPLPIDAQDAVVADGYPVGVLTHPKTGYTTRSNYV